MLTKWLRSPTAAAVAALFANGEPGAVFMAQKPAEWGVDANRVTMFQDNLGTTPVTALEQTVGLHLDTRPIYGKPTGPNTVGQPLRGVEQVTNGALTTSTGWSDASSAGGTLAFGTGGCTLTNTSGIPRLRQTLTVVPNTWNELRYDLSGVTTATPALSIGSTAGATDFYVNTALTAGTSKRLMFFATTSQAFVNFACNAAGAMVVANVSGKTVYGNHRSQSSAPARARLSARYNKVTARNANPVDLTNVAKAGDAAATLTLVSDAAALAAAGLTQCTLGNVYKLDNSLGVAAAFANVSGGSGNTNTQIATAYVRGGTGSIGFELPANSTAFGAAGAYTKRTRQAAAPSTVSAMFVSADAGQVVFFILPDFRESCYSYLPTPQIITGTGATAADYDDTGFPARLVYSGAQGSATGSVDFSACQQAQAFWGGAFLAINSGIAYELGASTATVDGSFNLYADSRANWGLRSTVAQEVIAGAATQPGAQVFSCAYDTTQATQATREPGRRNGASDVSSGSVTGPTTAGGFLQNGPLNFGSRGATGVTNPLTGDEFISIVRGGATPTTDVIASVERFAGQRMGIYL